MRWEAQPRQAEFLLRPEDEVLYGGAAGGGKTDALLIHGICTALEHPGARVLFLRRTFADLNKPGAAIDRSRMLLTARKSVTWNGQEHRWTFSNGSVLQFGHLQHPSDVYSYQGAQFDCLLWDELTQFTEDQYQFLRSRVRATVDGIRTTIRAATNPGGVGHAWVRERFVDAGPWGVPFTISGSVSACFIPAKISDNPALLDRDPEYAKRLADLPDALRRAYLEGDWDQFEGQVFTEWRRDAHVIAPLPIPSDWPRFHATDYGLNAPSCTLWAARSPRTGRVFVYRERYERNKTADQQALKIKLWSGDERYRRAVGDPSMWNRESTGRSIAQQFGQHGVSLTPATNDRRAGWLKLHEWLAWSEQQPPRLQVFANCTNLIRTLPAMVYDDKDVEDLDTDGEDHAVDALRYLVMAIDLVKGQERPAHTPYGMGKRRAA